MCARFAPMYAHLRATVLAALAILLVSGCSSKNPDALTGMNVDENLATMNANATSQINTEATNVSKTNGASPQDANGSAGSAAATRHGRGQRNNQERSAEVNAVAAISDNPADQESNGPNQVQNQEEPPSAS